MDERLRIEGSERDHHIASLRDYVMEGSPLERDAYLDLARHPEALTIQVEKLDHMMSDIADRQLGKGEEVKIEPEAGERLGKLRRLANLAMGFGYGDDNYGGPVTNIERPVALMGHRL